MKENKCLHCVYIDAPYLCENCPCEQGLLLLDEENTKMEKWNEIYKEQEN